MEHCSVTVFHTLGGLYAEVSRQETGLDTLLQRMTGDGLDPSVQLEELRA